MNLGRTSATPLPFDVGRLRAEAYPTAMRGSVPRVEPHAERIAATQTGLPDASVIALVGMNPQDQASLKKILEWSSCPHAPACKWQIRSETNVDSVLAAVRREPISMVICDRDSMADAWKDLLDRLAGLTRAPLLIVASRLADDRLWAEALNLGAYDVVSKPFDASEVGRIAGLACAHWHGLGTPTAAIYSVA